MAHGDVYSGKQWELAISQEDTWGAPESSGFLSLNVETVQPVDRSGLVNIFRRRAAGHRMPANTDYFVSKKGGIVQLPFECWATHDTLDMLLHGVLHDLVSESATTPYAKVWEWDEGTTKPLFSTVAAITTRGTLFTVVQAGPVASEFDQLVSCIISPLTISKSPGQPMVISGNFWSGHSGDYEHQNNTTITSATAPGEDYYIEEKTKTVAGSDVILGDYSITFDVNPLRLGNDSNGNAEEYSILGGDGPFVTGSIDILYDADSKDMIDAILTTSYDHAIALAYGSGGDPADTDGDLDITLNVNFDIGAVKDFGREEGVFFTLPFRGAFDGTNNMVDVSMANAVDRAWTA